jgi:hypothetical protein
MSPLYHHFRIRNWVIDIEAMWSLPFIGIGASGMYSRGFGGSCSLYFLVVRLDLGATRFECPDDAENEMKEFYS